MFSRRFWLRYAIEAIDDDDLTLAILPTSDRTLMNSATVRRLARVIDTDNVCSICDVGGRSGFALRTLLTLHESLSGVVFDRSDFEQATEVVMRDIDRQRWQFLDGSYFREIPSEHDRYLLVAVLASWSDQRCVGILDNVRTAMPEDARIWVVEDVRSKTNVTETANGDQCRLLREWQSLFSRAGLHVQNSARLVLDTWFFELSSADRLPD